MTEQSFTPIKKTLFIPGIAWFLFVLVLISLPGKDIPQSDWLDSINFDKLVHAGLFGGLVFWFCMPFRKAVMQPASKRNLFIRITLAAIVWGITTEVIQKYFVPGRQFDLLDWAADSAGAIVGYFISYYFFFRSPNP